MNPRIASALLSSLAFAALSACGGGSAPAPAETALEHAEKHLDPTYQCPMHPQITSQEPGECPICGMDLVPVEPVAAEPERQPLYYRHPHDPAVISPVPRKDEMGMDFVPVFGDADAGGDGTVTLSPAMVNNLGVRTAPVRRGAAGGWVETAGTTAFDERGRVEIRVRAEGYVERLEVRAAGERVRRGQRLFAVFSPRLAAAQREYLIARRLGDAPLAEAAAARLAALGLERAAIERLAATEQAAERVVYRAPTDGVVLELGVREGGLAEPGAAAIVLAPLDPLWVVAAVPEAQAARLGPEMRATVTVPALPGERFAARVVETLPALDETTRTVQLRLAVANPAGRLAAGMRANVLLESAARDDLVLAPAEAVIRTGRAERVIVALGGGRFAAREVVTGAEFGDEVEIRAGLAPGDVVVTSGQFMIDSESQVRESLRRLSAPVDSTDGAPVTPGARGGDGRAGEEGHAAHATDEGSHAGHGAGDGPQGHAGHDQHRH